MALFEPFNPLLVPLALGTTAAALAAYMLTRGPAGGDGSRAGFALRKALAALSRAPGERWYRWGLGAADPDLAVACLEEAARRDHVEAHFELGLFYEEGGHGPGGRDWAARHYRAAADRGHLEAGYRLAELLRWGIGPARDPGAAHRWYLRSANGGFRPAMDWLVRAFEFGEGVPEDLEKAVYWTVKAQALPPARLRLSHFARQPRPPAGEPPRHPAPALGPETASDPAEASFRQGMSYLGGTHGHPADPIAAGIWLQRAAEAGHVEAMAELAELLAWGVGGLAHSDEAAAWFQRAGSKGHQGAQIRLGRLEHPD